MVRAIVASLVLSCLATTSSAQTLSPQGPAQGATPATKPAAKKPASKTKATAKPSDPIANGPCRLGVIPAIGDTLGIKTIGLTVFGNEYAEAPIENWGIDDFVVAKVRAAAGPGVAVQRIAYAKGAFASYDNPPPALFRNSEDDLTAIVRRVVVNSNCERFVIITKFEAQFDGTNQIVRGVSVVRREIGDLINRTYLVANINVRVFDGQKLTILKPPVSLEKVLARAFVGQRDGREIDNALFPDSASAAVNDAKLRNEARALVAETLDGVLPTLPAQ